MPVRDWLSHGVYPVRYVARNIPKKSPTPNPPTLLCPSVIGYLMGYTPHQTERSEVLAIEKCNTIHGEHENDDRCILAEREHCAIEKVIDENGREGKCQLDNRRNTRLSMFEPPIVNPQSDHAG